MWSSVRCSNVDKFKTCISVQHVIEYLSHLMRKPCFRFFLLGKTFTTLLSKSLEISDIAKFHDHYTI